MLVKHIGIESLCLQLLLIILTLHINRVVAFCLSPFYGLENYPVVHGRMRGMNNLMYT